jgi:hypothetical protein
LTDHEKSVEPACGAGIDHRRRIIRLEQSDSEQWETINQLRNRPPVWATAVISLLTFLLGASVTYCAVLLNASA